MSELYSWGFNANGQTGQGTTSGSNSTPVQVGTDTDWDQVSAGEGFGVAVKNGEMYSWGFNGNGRTGLGTTSGTQTTPAQIGTDTNWASVAAGFDHALAIKTDGTLWAWGANANGKTGLGTTTGEQTTPAQVGADTDWLRVYAGSHHSLGLKTDGTLWAWGGNTSGKTGLGTATGDQTTPDQIGTDTDWLWAGAGTGDATGYSHGVKTDGTLWAWGSNSSGQTGLGTTSGTNNSPVQVGTDTDWVAVFTGNTHTLAVKTDGTLWAWGENLNGRTGLNTASGTTNSPTQVGTDTDWEVASAGGEHSLAVKEDGTLWAWGNNAQGRTGLGTTSGEQLVPAQVGGDIRWATLGTPRFTDEGAIAFSLATFTPTFVEDFESDLSTADEINAIQEAVIRDIFDSSDTFSLRVESTQDFISEASLGDLIDTTLGHLLQSKAALSDSAVSSGLLHYTFADKFTLRDRIRLGYFLELLNSVELSDAQEISVDQIALLISNALFSDEIDTQTKRLLTIAAALVLRDQVRFGYDLSYLDQATLADAIDDKYEALVVLQEIVALEDILGVNSSIQFLLTSTAELEDSVDSSAKLSALLSSSMTAAVILKVGEDVYEGWVLHSDDQAFTQYSSYPFTGIREFKGKHYGISDDGIYELGGGDDEGTPISASFKTGLLNLGVRAIKDARAFYLGYTGSGEMVLKATTTSGGKKREDWYKLKRKGTDDIRTGRATISRGLRSTYWQFELVNVEGADFEIDDVTIEYQVLARRIR